MPLFVCDNCKVIENTALGKYWGEKSPLCSECGWGKWHGSFEKETYDPDKWRKRDGDTNFVERMELP